MAEFIGYTVGYSLIPAALGIAAGYFNRKQTLANRITIGLGVYLMVLGLAFFGNRMG